ncbi:MAG: hypothetical protein AAFU77_03925 [Myxococcota bacterium]
MVPAPISYDRGVHLRGTPLWLDSARPRPLCIVTQAPLRPLAAHARVVVPLSLSDNPAVAGRAQSVLPAPNDRSMGVGGQQLTFLGLDRRWSVAALISVRGERFLFLPSGGAHSPEGWPSASHVVAPAPPVRFRGGPIERAVSGLVNFAENAFSANANPRVQVDDIDLAEALAARLSAAGFSVQRLGWLAKLGPAAETLGEAVRAAQGGRRIRIAVDGRPKPSARVAVVESRRGPGAKEVPRMATFRVNWHGDYAALGCLARSVKATKITICGDSGGIPGEEWAKGLDLTVLGTQRQLVFRRGGRAGAGLGRQIES